MSKWPSVKHFTSWLGLCPHNRKTGGKIMSTKTKKTSNRANLALRQAATSLYRSNSALGQYYRRKRAALGTPKAVVATAHKLARIIYYMLKHQVPYEAVPPEQAEARHRERQLRQLKHRARQLGVEVLVPEELNVISGSDAVVT